MTTLKAEIKMGTASEIGARLDDLLEQAQKEVASYEGGKLALNIAYAKLNEHLKFIDKDVDEGKLDLQQAELVKRYFLHAIGIVQNLGTGADVQKIQAQGKVVAYEASVKATKGIFDAEKAKAAAIHASVESGGTTASVLSLVQRPVGQHPGDPLAERRSEEVPLPPIPEAPPVAVAPVAMPAPVTKFTRGRKGKRR